MSAPEPLVHARIRNGAVFTMCGLRIKVDAGTFLRCTAVATKITCPACERLSPR